MQQLETGDRTMIKRIKEWAIRKLGGFTSGDCELLYGPFARTVHIVRHDVQTERVYANLKIGKDMIPYITGDQIRKRLVSEIAGQIEPFVEFRCSQLEPPYYETATCRAKLTVLIPENGGVIQHDSP